MSIAAPLPRAIVDVPVVAVIRAPRADAYEAIIAPLVEGGIRAVELTLTTPGTLEALPRLRETLPRELALGVGTVRSVRDLTQAADHGADFIVSPHTDPASIAAALEAGVPIIPGAATATEVHTALTAGATAIKLFPASLVTPGIAKQLLGPFPELVFMPSGGVELADVPAWFAAGAVAVSAGGPLVGDTSDPDPRRLRTQAERFVAAAQS